MREKQLPAPREFCLSSEAQPFTAQRRALHADRPPLPNGFLVLEGRPELLILNAAPEHHSKGILGSRDALHGRPLLVVGRTRPRLALHLRSLVQGHAPTVNPPRPRVVDLLALGPAEWRRNFLRECRYPLLELTRHKARARVNE